MTRYRYSGLIDCAPINIVPHYSSLGLCKGKGGGFDLDLTLKHAPYTGNLTTCHTFVQKCEH